MVFIPVHATLHRSTMQQQIHADLAVQQSRMLIQQITLLDIVHAARHITLISLHPHALSTVHWSRTPMESTIALLLAIATATMPSIKHYPFAELTVANMIKPSSNSIPILLNAYVILDIFGTAQFLLVLPYPPHLQLMASLLQDLLLGLLELVELLLHLSL